MKSLGQDRIIGCRHADGGTMANDDFSDRDPQGTGIAGQAEFLRDAGTGGNADSLWRFGQSERCPVVQSGGWFLGHTINQQMEIGIRRRW